MKRTGEELNKIKNGVLHNLNLGPRVLSDIEQLMLRVADVKAHADAFAKGIDDAVKAQGHNQDLPAFRQSIEKFYLDKFVHYNKDELLLVLTILMAKQTCDEFI